MMRTGVLLLLGYTAAEDLRKRSIPVIPVTAFAMLLLFLRFLYFRQEFDLRVFLAGALPGVFFFLISIVTKGEAGSGDALIILLIGLITGFPDAGMTCFLALVLAGFTGLGLIAAGKAGRKSQLPFVPFLLISYVLLMAAGLLELS